MELIKNIIANTIFYIGFYIMNSGTWLHKKFRTKTGLALSYLEELQISYKKNNKLEDDFDKDEITTNGAFYVKNKSGNS